MHPGVLVSQVVTVPKNQGQKQVRAVGFFVPEPGRERPGLCSPSLSRCRPIVDERSNDMPHLGTPELLIILALVLVLFGAKEVPEMARGLGQGMKEFKQAMREAAADREEHTPAEGSIASREEEPARAI
jgi:sec-independent protein translocase protein TatA